MRTGLILAAVAAVVLVIAPARAAPPDDAFSQAHVAFIEAKAAEFLAPYNGPTPAGRRG